MGSSNKMEAQPKQPANLVSVARNKRRKQRESQKSKRQTSRLVAVILAVSLVVAWIYSDADVNNSSGRNDNISDATSPLPPIHNKKRHASYNADKLPAEIHAGHVAMFYAKNDLDQLHWGLQTIFEQSSRVNLEKEATPRMRALGTGYDYTSRYKLQHDYEQAMYLSNHLQDKQQQAYFQNVVAPIYKRVMDNNSATVGGLVAFSDKDKKETGINKVYNRALHVTNLDTMRDQYGNPISLLNPQINAQQVERQWFGAEQHQFYDHPGIIVIDDVMKPQVLERVRQIMLESTVFYQTKQQTAAKQIGYVGAYLSDGLHDRLLMDFAMQISQTFPRIFQGHPLNFIWAYKYDSNYDGIQIHADEAAVNVNCWLTPDEANLDPESGGLVVYTAKPPLDWDFARYNSNERYVKEHLLKPTGFANVTVPHKQNRCVIFDSALFHNTDKFHFRKGYENRRINLTMLYGEMQKATAAAAARRDL